MLPPFPSDCEQEMFARNLLHIYLLETALPQHRFHLLGGVIGFAPYPLAFMPFGEIGYQYRPPRFQDPLRFAEGGDGVRIA